MDSIKSDGSSAKKTRCQKKDKTYFQDVANKLSSTEIDGLTLKNILLELRSNISSLEKENCDNLVNVVMKVDWLSHKPDVIDLYKAFLVQFVSAHPNTLRKVLHYLIKKFYGSETDKEFEKLKHVHEVLLAILKLVPLADQLTIVLLSDCFPFLRKSAEIQLMYTKNLLQMTSYFPAKRREILDIIIEHMIRVDVLSPRQKMLELLASKEDYGSEMEIESNETADDLMFKALVKTLDCLMNVVFTYINAVCVPDENLDWEATKQLYQEIYSIFNDRCLKTQTSHVQFLLFYLCSLKPAICEATLDRLWKNFLNPNTPNVLRQMSTMYIGALLVRGNFIQLNLVTSCLEALVSWIHEYIDVQNDSSSIVLDYKLHLPFYYACQTAFYVFSSWHQELLHTRKGFKYVQSFNFERIVTCQLNPLSICNPAIVANFAAIARNYQLAYCYTVIERNERAALSVFGVSDNFTFSDATPFDPYLLEESVKFIEEIYRQNESVDDYEDKTVTKDGEDDEFLRDSVFSGDEGTSPNKLSDFFRNEFSANKSK